MQFPSSSREDHFAMFEKYYSAEDTQDLRYTNTELGERVYVDFSSVTRDTPPELLYVCQIVQALIVIPGTGANWYMLEHAVLSPQGQLYLQYSVHDSDNHSLPVDSFPLSKEVAIRRFVHPIDITKIESLAIYADILQRIVTNGLLSQLGTYTTPASSDSMIAVHAIGQENARYLHPAHKSDLAMECVARGMWSLLKIRSSGFDVDLNLYSEITNTEWYYCPGYGLVSQPETDEVTGQTYYREIVRWVEDDSDDESDESDE